MDDIEPVHRDGDERTGAAFLRTTTIAVRVKIERLGVRKALSKDQLHAAADAFDADAAHLSASKRLFDTKDPAYRDVTTAISAIVSYWHSVTIPYPDRSVRLLKRSEIGAFNSRMCELAAELRHAAAKLQNHFVELREHARGYLGMLFDDRDYPDDVEVEFRVSWDYPSIEAPAYLEELNITIYEEERLKVQARFEHAVAVVEQSSAAHLVELITNLVDRLGREEHGYLNGFRNSSYENLRKFVARFDEFYPCCGGLLQRAVDDLTVMIDGITPDILRTEPVVRSRVHDQLNTILPKLEFVRRPSSDPKRSIDADTAPAD